MSARQVHPGAQAALRRSFEAHIAAMAARPVARDRQAEANPAGHRNTAEFRGRHSWGRSQGDRRAAEQSGVVCRGLMQDALLFGVARHLLARQIYLIYVK